MPTCSRSFCPTPSSTSAFPAIRAPTCPTAQALEGYDGVAITGSGLHVYDDGAAGDPADRAGARRARGRHAGVRKLLGPAGAHRRRRRRRPQESEGPRDRLRPRASSSPSPAASIRCMSASPRCSTRRPCISTRSRPSRPGTTVLATNEVSDVQSAEIRCNGAVAWGVQYHPEYPLREIAAIVRRIGLRLIDEGFFLDTQEIATFADDLDDARPRSGREAAVLALRHQQERAGQEASHRRGGELAQYQVLPTRAKRGRALDDGADLVEARNDSPASARSTDRRGRGSTGNST